MHRLALRALGAAAVLAAAAFAAPAAENHGRELKTGEVVWTSIYPSDDVDQFVFEAGAGFKVNFTMKVKGQVVLPPPPEGEEPELLLPLLPTLELVDPAGAVHTDGVVARASKRSAKLKATLPSGGRWAIRAKGVGGTGTCTLSWKLKTAKVAAQRKLPVAGDQTLEFPFPATGGATVSWNLSFKGDGAAQVIRVLDPDGAEVPYDPEDETYVLRRITSERVKNLPLPARAAGGDYRLVVFNDLFPVTMNLSIRVALPRLPKSEASLTLVEPVLTGISTDQGACGVQVRVDGSDLGTAPQGVLFGGEFATGVVVAGDGKSFDCVVPHGTGTVDIVYVATDGQQAVLADSFTFLPFPTVTGISPTVGPNAGGVELRVFGQGFLQGPSIYDVLVGGVNASQVQVVSETELRCVVPAHVSGPKTVIVRNDCAEQAVSPQQFTYSTGLNISTVAPSAVPSFGGVPVTVYGTGFQATDQVFIDGALVPSTPVTFSSTVIGHRVEGANVAAHAPGTVHVKVRAASSAETTKFDGLAYYSFQDVTATSIPEATATDDWGGVSTVFVDRNADGRADQLVITHDQQLSGTRPGTRVLENQGAGVFTDATSLLMPAPTMTEDWAGKQVLSARLDSGSNPDLLLVRPGTGIEAQTDSSKLRIDAFARMFFGQGGGEYSPQPHSGPDSKFGIFGQLIYSFGGSKCYLFDFDFRGVAGSMGDLDGDLDQDLVLVNDRSIRWYKGVNCNYVWITCIGYYASCYSFQTYDVGSALRICTLGSTGGAFDRTSSFLTTGFTTTDDFRGVSCFVGDMDADFLNDIVVTHNGPPGPGGTLAAATRVFRQKSSGVNVTFQRISGFLPAPASAADDDWRGDSVAAPDLNTDLYRDLVIALNSAVPNGRTHSTRVLIHNPSLQKLEDRTAEVLGPALPAGDTGLARFVLATDFDKDGDADIFLATPDSTGAGNRRTRFLLNAGKDPSTGLPVLIDASGLLPPESSDPGNAVTLAVGDVDGDGDLDLAVTDTHVPAGGVRRTRLWKQVR
jgi:hypothetical protein